jgi:hypothetical protein
MPAASSSTVVRVVQRSDGTGVLLVAPWSTRCDNFIWWLGAIPHLLKVASEHWEVHLDASGTSRRAYVEKVFLYFSLPPLEQRAPLNKSAPVHSEGSREYASYFRSDTVHILKGMVILSLLADRHAYLHKVYYKDMHDRMEKHIRQLDVLFMTTTPLKKVNSSSVSWVPYVRRDCPRRLVQDGIGDTPTPGIAAVAWTIAV